MAPHTNAKYDSNPNLNSNPDHKPNRIFNLKSSANPDE